MPSDPRPPGGLSRDAEADLLCLAWQEMTQRPVAAIEPLLREDRFLDAAIELAGEVMGGGRLLGWQLTFTSVGPPYAVQLFHGGPAERTTEGTSDLAPSVAFTRAVRQWRDGRA